MNCGGRLAYTGIYYSHIGIWHCERCGQKRPKPDLDRWNEVLPGLYNQYNTLAAVTTALSLGIPKASIKKALSGFSPAFGRQEEFVFEGRTIKIFLSKNPASFNASLRTVLEQGAKNMLLVLNDRIPDGRDISWIWDVDLEMIPKNANVIVAGDRVYDLALRVKYSRKSQISNLPSLAPRSGAGKSQKLLIEPELTKALKKALEQTPKNQILYILPTYSAMLEVRKILTGRKIL